ncbi:MAG TPA: VWA domain-containing protein [Candidatus Korarchaeota archaeon]|nr:VWA domain-containing protein [Candidatus Korarchaeota archaeon]
MTRIGVDRFWVLPLASLLGWSLLIWLHLKVRGILAIMKRELDFGGESPWRNLYRLVFISRLVFVFCLALLLADPYYVRVQTIEITPDKIDPKQIQGLNVILLLDVSKSMGYGSRFDAVRDFLDNLVEEFGSNTTITLVKFSGSADLIYSGEPEGVKSLLKSLAPNESYTSIGDALLFALYLAKTSNIPSTIIFISDGGNNGGSDPIDAAKTLAKSNLSTISVQVGSGARADPKLMNEIAKETNGHFFRLDQASYEEIISLAKETARSASYKALESSNKLSVDVELKDYESVHRTLLLIIGMLVLLQILGGA